MYIAKEAVSSVLASIPNARYGLMRYHQGESSTKSLYGYWYQADLHYNGDSGSDLNCNRDSDILVNIGENTSSSILSWMDGIETYPTDKELRGDGATPLARSLTKALNYFQGTVIPNDPSRACRQNYVILVTDGLETCGGNPCNAARRLRNVRVQGETYDIKTYVVGLAIPQSLRANLNCVAREGGTGEPLFANDVVELEQVLTQALNEITAGEFTASAPTITTIPFDPSLENRVANNALLVTGLSLPNWNGSLKAYEIFSESSPGSGTFLRNDPLLLRWDAGEQLATKPSSERQIFTWINGGRFDFVEANAATLNPYLGIVDDLNFTETNRFIRYLQGVDVYDDDGDGNISEDRLWKLGDIYHSTAALVGPPSYTFDDDSYKNFKAQYAERPKAIYVGSNDGMLHAFDALTGGELWGFVPPSLLNKLYQQTSNHTFYVDLSPKVDDAKLNLSFSTTGWSTVLMIGQGWGGGAYTALDISDPFTPRLLWEFSDTLRLGETWSVPAIGRVYYSGAEQWIAVFGSGNMPLSANGALFIVDLKTGAEVLSFSESGTTIVADPVLVNLNPEIDERIDIGYIGDMNGRLHKLNFSPIAPNPWVLCRFYTFGSSKPIVSSAIIEEDAATGALYVMVGSGLDTSQNQGSQQELVVLRDDDLTGACQAAFKVCQINLTTGERVITTGIAENGTLFFTTFLPDPGGNACSPGQSFLRCVQFETCSDAACGGQGTGAVSAGQGKATDPVYADEHIFFVLSTGTIVDIGDSTAPVNQEAPFAEQLFFFAHD
jgi:outer membrane protein assembly factor BamB